MMFGSRAAPKSSASTERRTSWETPGLPRGKAGGTSAEFIRGSLTFRPCFHFSGRTAGALLTLALGIFVLG